MFRRRGRERGPDRNQKKKKLTRSPFFPLQNSTAALSPTAPRRPGPASRSTPPAAPVAAPASNAHPARSAPAPQSTGSSLIRVSPGRRPPCCCGGSFPCRRRFWERLSSSRTFSGRGGTWITVGAGTGEEEEQEEGSLTRGTWEGRRWARSLGRRCGGEGRGGDFFFSFVFHFFFVTPVESRLLLSLHLLPHSLLLQPPWRSSP